MNRSLFFILGLCAASPVVFAQAGSVAQPGRSPVAGPAAAQSSVAQDWSMAVRQIRDEARVRLGWLEAYISQADLKTAWQDQMAAVSAVKSDPQISSAAYGTYERLRRSVLEALSLSPHQIAAVEAGDRSKADWLDLEQLEKRIDLAEAFLEKQGRFRESRQWIQTQVRSGAGGVQAGLVGPSGVRMLAVLNAQRRKNNAQVDGIASLAGFGSVGPVAGSVTHNRISRPASGSSGPASSVVAPIFYSQLNQASPGPNQAVTIIGVGSVFIMQTGSIRYGITPLGWNGVGRVAP